MLWVMRHGSAGPTTDAKDDDKRPLSLEGELEAKAAGIALEKLKTPIQAVIASPLTRAHQTAELVAEALGLEVHIESKLAGGPLTDKEIRLICKPYGNCLLVGHAPAVNLWVYNMTGCQMQHAKGGLTQIHEGEVWSMLNPSTCMVMADMGEFEDPQEVDHRAGDDDKLVVQQPKRTKRMIFLHQTPVAMPDWKL